MAEQFIVAAFLDGTLNVTACGPYRSEQKAREIARAIDDAGGWSVDSGGPTILAQVVPLGTAAAVIAAASEPEAPDG